MWLSIYLERCSEWPDCGCANGYCPPADGE
jgi:hypothetical protein